VKVREGLTAAVPDSWSPSSDKDCPDCDRFLGDYGAELLLITNPGFCPPEVCIDGLMDMVEERGGQATTHRARMINGVTWQVASMVDRGSEGDRYALTAGVTNLGGLFVVVYSWDGPGQQRSAQTMFDQFAWTLTLGS
jgi:hypothetical protein